MVDFTRARTVIQPNPNRSDPPPFNKMTFEGFEGMCCALLAKEPGIVSADLFHGNREPQFGVDVTGILHDGGMIVISCKCYTAIKRGNLSEWSNDFLGNWIERWQHHGVRRFIMAIAADARSSKRQIEIEAQKLRFAEIGVDYQIWSPRHLLTKLHSRPGIVSYFLGAEWVPSICGISEVEPTDPKHFLEERQLHWEANEFKEAAECAEEAARIAREVNDKKTLITALRSSASDLGNEFVSQRLNPEEKKGKEIIARIASNFAELDNLDPDETNRALRQGTLALHEGRSNDAIKFAEIAEKNAHGPQEVAFSLILQLKANRQLEAPDPGLMLKHRIDKVSAALEVSELSLHLRANWLRTLLEASKINDEDVLEFISSVRATVAQAQLPPAPALKLVDSVVTGFGEAQHLSASRLLLELSLELAGSINESMHAATIAIQIAEIEAEMGNETGARQHVGISDKWLDTLKSGKDKKAWASRKAMALAANGRIESRLARVTEKSDFKRSIQHRRAAYDAQKKALAFIDAHESALLGDVGPFRAELNLRLGDAAAALGRHLEAADHFRHARTDQVMADSQFKQIGMLASMREADSLLLGGKAIEAGRHLKEVIAAPWVTEDIRDKAQQNIHWIDEHIRSVTEWLESGPATTIRKTVSVEREGLRRVVAAQMQPLLEWFREFPPRTGVGHAYSELFDVWGRGGFSRIVAAVRADPLNCISVDASTVSEIRRWARIFCPLYDTVIVNWKGHLDAGLAIVPMPDNLGPPGAFGGQGYARTSDTLSGKKGWHVAVGWGNFLPTEISEFLATEALPLLRSGRLVLLPSPLVGCTQNAVGWSDNLLVDGLFGGVVKSASMLNEPSDRTLRGNGSQTLNLGAVSIPFIDDIDLSELDRVLDDTLEWISPLRKLLHGSLGGPQLRNESWSGLQSSLKDIRDSIRELRERYKLLVTSLKERAGWRVAGATGAFSAAMRLEDTPGFDSVTNLLRSITGNKPDLGPWIPFWRMQEAGGAINWTTPLNNRSEPPSENALRSGDFSEVSQAWLVPGDGGPGIAAMRKFVDE